jgi:RimJ/RimL family protein N-acetyltransferase
LRTARLELRLPDENDLVELGELARQGIHPREFMPFRIPWTDNSDAPDFVERFAAHHLELRQAWHPDQWRLLLGVWVDDRVIGAQDLRADRFSETHTTESGSWLGERYQGQGYGTEMREAVLSLAFAGLGAAAATSGSFEGNIASARVSEKLGYVESGEDFHEPRGVRVREQKYTLTREAWLSHERPAVEIMGLEPCMPLFGV